MNKTQIKIIEAAEREFSERGFHGASIRDITSKAGANVAAINYHFGSKEELFIAMIRYRIEPVNKIRLEMIEDELAQNHGAPIKLERLIEILIRPLFRFFNKGSRSRHFMRAMVRGMSEDSQFRVALRKDVLADLIQRFRKELGRTLVNASPDQVDHCFALIASTLSGVIQHRQDAANAKKRIDFPDADKLIAFVVGGIRAVTNIDRSQSKT